MCRCLRLKAQLWKEAATKGKSQWLMLMTLHQGQRGLVFQRECMTLTCSDLMLHFRPIWTTFEMLHCWLNCWSVISLRHQYSHMVCHQGLELSSLKSWGCIWKLGERILCQCNCWRRGNQVLGERKAVLSYTHLLSWYSTHQQANITYPTDIWWTKSGWGGS